eukprot:TRINITY_DN3413_c0_g2_i1.p1 TRINITY_DN3413_c0_g2~~TRINITY_DN3413_c0_g2_i1.p1  ORF type:complete len:333 (-),score=126.32 TRINITY_DN3413_c0_g2_i1:260-1213(-)
MEAKPEEEIKDKQNSQQPQGQPLDHMLHLPDIEPEVPVNEEELEPLVIQQVEYYFSDENLPHDHFLLTKLAEGNGFVQLELIANFPKMKKLTKSLDLIRKFLRKSQDLVLDENGNLLTRKNLDPALLVSEERALAVFSLPKNTDEAGVRNLFPNLGILQVQLKTEPNGEPSALVFFSSEGDVKKAFKDFKKNNQSQDWRNGMRIQYANKQREVKNTNEKKKKKEKVEATPQQQVTVYEKDPTHSFLDNKKKGQQRKPKSGKEEKKWEPDPSSSSLRPKLALKPKTITAVEEAPQIVPIRQPLGPDGTKGFTSRGKLS